VWQSSRVRKLEERNQLLRDALSQIDGYALTVALTAADEDQALIARTVLNITHPALRSAQ
jgi:hypothetical protein